MAGLLDFLGLGDLSGGGGLLGNLQQPQQPMAMPPQAPPPMDMGGGLSQMLSGLGQRMQGLPDNPLFAAGMGMLSGQNLQGGFGNAMANMQHQREQAEKRGNTQLAQYIAMKQLELQQQHGGLEERKVSLAEKQAVDKPTFGHIGVDRNGNPLYGFINAGQGTAKPYLPEGGAGVGGPSSDLTGQPFLDSLNDPGRSAQIRAITEGRMTPPGGFAMKSPQIQGLLRDTAQYEPGFDMTKWTARNSTAKDFASGKAAANVTSLNTVVGHLGDLMEKSDALGNFGNIPLANQTANEIKNWYTKRSGSEAVSNFELARNAVSDEMAKVFRQSGMSDAEVRQWKENLSTAFSPEQMRGAVKTAVGLMDSRLGALADQRARGMDTQIEPRSLLNQKSLDTLKRLESWATGGPAKIVAPKDQGQVPDTEFPKRLRFNPASGKLE